MLWAVLCDNVKKVFSLGSEWGEGGWSADLTPQTTPPVDHRTAKIQFFSTPFLNHHMPKVNDVVVPNNGASAPSTSVTEVRRQEALSGSPNRTALMTTLVFVGFHLVYVILPLAFIATPFILLMAGHSIAGTVAFASYGVWFVLSVSSERKLGRPWPWFENLPVFSYLFAYFPFNITRAKPLRHHKADPSEYPNVRP
jgi:hypothetical protein